MHHIRLLCAIGVSLWAAAVAGSQAPAGLPGALRAHVKDEPFGLVTSIRGLPLGVRDELQTLFGSPSLDIAEPGAKIPGHRRGRRSDAAEPPAGRGGVLDRSLPRLLRAGRHCSHVARGAVSLDARRDSVRVGRCRAERPCEYRGRQERRPVRSDQKPEQALVVVRSRAGKLPANSACRSISRPSS